ncbi:MAG: RHS repeat-associated core domain-containing protein [Candidatus Rhabdochlamydia sp.]
MIIRLILSFIACLFCFQHANAAQTSVYLGSREGDPTSLVENVSTIHGDYTEIEVDLVVTAPDSLILSRFYSSRDTFQVATFGGWRFNPQCFLTMQKDPKGKTYSSAEGTFERTFVYVGNSNGSILTYVGWRNITNPTKRSLFEIDAEIESAGIANTARGNVGAWTNLKNNKLYYDPQTDSFELLLCTEGKRFYVKSPTENFYCITHEILPSGNKIFYEFDENNQLVLIKETNAAEKKDLAWIKLQYENGVHIQTSDGQTAEYQFQKDATGIQLLTSVARSNKPDLHYQYEIVDNYALLVKKTLPEGRFVQVEYYLSYYSGKSKRKVSSVITPSSSKETFKTRFTYKENCTEVSRNGAHTAIYLFNKDLQLIAIKQALDSFPYRIHKKSWGEKSDAGNLISTSVADKKGNVLYHKYFIYDTKGNIVEEREYADVAGSGAIALDIDKNGLVLNQDGHSKYYSYFSGENTQGVFQRDAKGAGVKHWYKKGTNLLIKKLTLTNGSLDSENEDHQSGIKQRFFYTYNEDAALIQVVIDDGEETDPKDFHGVTERKITKISPKQEIPHVGAPEVIEQKYSSLDGESLLKRTIHHFDLLGNITSQEVYDSNKVLCYTINTGYTHGLLIFETDPMGNETHYSYDANQNLTTETHSDTGISVEYGYDLRNRLVSTVEKDRMGNRLKTQIAYDAAGYTCKVIDPFGNQTLYENDSLGRPIRITYPETSSGWHSSVKPTHTYTYDLFDNQISIQSRGITLTKSYNVKGKPTKINHLDGTKEVFRYDNGGNLHHHYRRDGILEVFEYDYMGRPTKLAYYQRGNSSSSFKETSCQYSTFHKISETDAQSKKTMYTYDKAGRLTTLEKENQKVEFIYDSLGRTQSIKTGKSDFTLEIKDYDLLGRVIEERTEDSLGRTLIKKKFLYNDAGELAKLIGYPQNQESLLMQYEYDGFGRLIKTTNAVGSATQIIYDDAYINSWGQKGSKRTLIDPMDNKIEEIFDNDAQLIQIYKRDKSGNLLSYVETSYDTGNNKQFEKARILSLNEPERNYEIEYFHNQKDQIQSILIERTRRNIRFEYNSYAELTKKALPSESITYQYDNCGDLEFITFYKEDKKETNFKLSYDYNKNLTSMSRDDLSLCYLYDGNDLPVSKTIHDEFGSYQVRCIYNQEGKVKTLTFPDESYVEYTYEGPLVKSISRFNKDNKQIYAYKVSSRDQMGNILEEILPEDLGKRIQSWDKAGRRVGISTDFFQDKVLEYDPLDNIKKRETSLGKEQVTSEYEYNALLQLISEKGNATHNYSYDSIGNRLKKDESSYKINDLNELIGAEGSKYTSHYNGHISTKTVKGSTRAYQSNPLNQLTSIKDANQTITFTYDLTGKRLSKCIEAKDKDPKILRFFYLNNTEVGCVDEKGDIIELKIPSNPNNAEAPCIAIELKNKIYFPIYDLQGNVACLLDHKSRKVVESYRYSAYGEEEITNGIGDIISDSLTGNPWRYRGKRIDKEIGLIYFGYRYYDPEIGRWISPDPLGTIDGLNLYAYAHNNPMTYVDYFGLSSDISENQGCACGYCVRGEGFCHCMGEDPTSDINRCGCIGIACNHKKISRIKIGNSITSALSGMSHGVVDFVIGSLHDLQTAAVYMGSADLEMSLYERSAMIEAVEQSQMQQLAAMGSHFMGMLSIDASDAFYQSFRSKTTLGLEMGSLVAGGYGAVKGVIAFNRLARAPVQVAKLAEGIINKSIKANPIWSSTKKRTAVQNAYRHWKDHGHEFSSLQNSKQYVEATRDFIRNSPVGTLTKIRSNGDVVFYDPSSNIFAITNQNGLPRTMYKPAPSIHSYPTNLEYFYAQ